jgi:GLTT repeat (6 copies)
MAGIATGIIMAAATIVAIAMAIGITAPGIAAIGITAAGITAIGIAAGGIRCTRRWVLGPYGWHWVRRCW